MLIIIYAILSNGGLVTVKYRFNKSNNLFTISGLGMYVISFLLYMFLLHKYNLSVIVPITTGVSYILLFLMSTFVLKESMSILQMIGFFLVMLGVIFINVK